MNKKGGIVLRDIFFIVLLVSSIFIFAGIFIQEMALSYDDSDMYNEFNNSYVYKTNFDQFEETSLDLNDSGAFMGSDQGLPLFLAVLDSLEAAGDILMLVLTFPNKIGDIVEMTLISLEINTTLSRYVGYMVTGLLWALVLFALITAFLKGGKM